MSKYLKAFAFVALIFSFTFLFPVSSQAANYKSSIREGFLIYSVNSSYGLNIRDVNCQRIATARYRTPLFNTDQYSGMGGIKNITCKVGSANFTMLPISYNGKVAYVAERFLAPMMGRDFGGGITSLVSAPGGLNLRDANCNRILTMPNGITVNNSPKTLVCRVSGVDHYMHMVTYNGKTGYASSAYLQ